jgi:hypothetical protein
MTIRHLTRKVTAKNAESTTLLVTIAGSGFHTKGEMMSEEDTSYNGIELLEGYRHIFHFKMNGQELQVYFSKTGRSIRVFKNGKELK